MSMSIAPQFIHLPTVCHIQIRFLIRLVLYQLPGIHCRSFLFIKCLPAWIYLKGEDIHEVLLNWNKVKSGITFCLKGYWNSMEIETFKKKSFKIFINSLPLDIFPSQTSSRWKRKILYLIDITHILSRSYIYRLLAVDVLITTSWAFEINGNESHTQSLSLSSSSHIITADENTHTICERKAQRDSVNQLTMWPLLQN